MAPSPRKNHGAALDTVPPPPDEQEALTTSSPDDMSETASDNTAATTVTSGDKAAPRPSYPPAPSKPTQNGPRGITYDFNNGARVLLPTRERGKWRIRLRDLDTGNILFQSENKGAFVSSSKRYYVRIAIDVWNIDDAGRETLVFEHEYNAHDREVVILFPIGTLGDTMGWFPYAARFAAARGARVTLAMSGLIIPLLRDTYPNLKFVTHEELTEQKLQEKAYATYRLGLFFDDKDCIHQPTDFRLVGLHRTAGYILGVDPTEAPPRLSLPDESRPIPEPYVVVAAQSSTESKNWTNPNGWREVVAFLKQSGYRVICIDQKPVHGTGIVWNHMPYGAEDETGDRPLAERARWLRHCDFFIGLSSGLSWLAWAAGAKIVLISGFTHPTNEFATPWRVINWHVCNSCWNDVRHRFDHKDFLWCPRHAGTPRQFECSRLITPAQVIKVIETIPGFAAHMPREAAC
jgi:autotransporter strand-loop-strand O-heptosyltransferase